LIGSHSPPSGHLLRSFNVEELLCNIAREDLLENRKRGLDNL
jgi:hypothetical protein